MSIKTDICLILEGTYPYVSGGVSSWVHELITSQSHLSFSLITMLAPGSRTVAKYKLPPNVLETKTFFLQELPEGATRIKNQGAFFEKLYDLLGTFHKRSVREDLEHLLDLFSVHKGQLGARVLLNSDEAWEMLQTMYNRRFSGASFLDYFWSWRSIYASFFSILLTEIPNAKAYHTLCTGYAGLLAARSKIETGAPCLITEHGIYTNERRIELSMADWLHEGNQYDLGIQNGQLELKDFWMQTFSCYSKLCYAASDFIVTLFGENQRFQLADGAPDNKLRIIPNGVDVDLFSSVPHAFNNDEPHIALIGRVVPIKDIKTYIQACRMIKNQIPTLIAYIMGPYDEDATYYEECKALVSQLNLEDTICFTGQVRLSEHLGTIDLVILTSLSEAQPLVLLEAGATGIPVIATDVGACSEIILGRDDETPPLGPGGAIAVLGNPGDIAHQSLQLLENGDKLRQYGQSLQQRVRRYYNKHGQHSSYRDLYEEVLALTKA